MPAPYRRLKSLRAEIRPTLQSYGAGAASTSNSSVDLLAYASSDLWAELSHPRSTKRHSIKEESDKEVISIAVEWLEDRRLREKGKAKSLIIHVKKTDQPAVEGRILYVPSHLIPPYSPVSLYASLHLHSPVEISLAVLQPIISSSSMSDSVHLDIGDFNVSSLYPLGSEHRTNGTNGHINGYHPQPAQILRQGETLSLQRHTGSYQNLKILLLDPVQQGIITSTTRLIVTSTPHILDPIDSTWRDVDGAMSESSHGRTHLSMADFDPDTFLSSSLDLHLNQPGALPDGSPTLDGVDLAHSISSSTSGSITPRPNGHAPHTPPSPPAPLEEILADEAGVEIGGTKFSVVVASGASPSVLDGPEDEVCWMGVSGLGRAGIFEGDWVLLRAAQGSSDPACNGRLVKALAWERLDEESPDLPVNPLVLSPYLRRSILSSPHSASLEVIVSPTSFGARRPALPIARTMTLARIATAEGADKRYERSWLRSLRAHFDSGKGKGKAAEEGMKMVRRGDVIAVPIWIDKPLEKEEDLDAESSGSSSESDHDAVRWQSTPRQPPATALGYFQVTALSYEPLVPLEEDFRSSASSKARAGELGCWVDIGKEGSTRLVLTGLEKSRQGGRGEDKEWQKLDSYPSPVNQKAAGRLRNLLKSCFSNLSIVSALQLSILVKGGRGSGKSSLISYLADELGYSVVQVEVYDVIGDTPAQTEGAIVAAVEKASSCAPSVLLVKHVEALARKNDSGTGKVPPIVKVLEDALASLRTASGDSGWPSIVVGTTCDADAVPGEVLGCFKQEIELGAPNEAERLLIATHILRDIPFAPDVAVSTIAAQSAALQAADIAALIHRAQDLALQRIIMSTQRSTAELRLAGMPLTAKDIDVALAEARASYSDSIGAPKIPNVRWEDVGGLANVKKEILETVQLPLERPELFAEGLKKRSGILLYGPPGTGKTLLAKAVATSCSLNFFSVKGPELLNMYIGESEANVRRVFQRARDASPCIIFMDELDSVAPKRGNQGDSGGVMDRIVSQLLAELDGMSKGDGGDVFVMGATNRPDLLDPALLRPGRFDRMLYLDVARTHAAQLSILQALTRKFKIDEALDLEEIADMCPFNYTGADFYALCSDAMLRAMTRKAEEVDRKIELLNDSPPPHNFPHPLTPQYYLSTVARPDEIEVRVNRGDFVGSLEKLNPSVSTEEMRHYERVQREFRGYNIGQGEDE